MQNEMTADQLREVLARHGGNIAAAAREMGVTRATVYRWMKNHSIQIGRVVKAA